MRSEKLTGQEWCDRVYCQIIRPSVLTSHGSPAVARLFLAVFFFRISTGLIQYLLFIFDSLEFINAPQITIFYWHMYACIRGYVDIPEISCKKT